MFCNFSHRYNPFLVFHKHMSEGNIHNKQIIFKVNNKSTKKSAKICRKLAKASKRHDRHCCGIPFVKLIFECWVVVPLIFKNVRRTKKVYNKCILKWSFFSKLLTTLNGKLFSQKSTILDVSQVLSSPLTAINKCFLRTTNELYHGFLEWWLLLTSRDFTCSKSKSTIETLKTLEHNVKCV